VLDFDAPGAVSGGVVFAGVSSIITAVARPSEFFLLFFNELGRESRTSDALLKTVSRG